MCCLLYREVVHVAREDHRVLMHIFADAAEFTGQVANQIDIRHGPVDALN